MLLHHVPMHLLILFALCYLREEKLKTKKCAFIVAFIYFQLLAHEIATIYLYHSTVQSPTYFGCP